MCVCHSASSSRWASIHSMAVVLASLGRASSRNGVESSGEVMRAFGSVCRSVHGRFRAPGLEQGDGILRLDVHVLVRGSFIVVGDLRSELDLHVLHTWEL